MQSRAVRSPAKSPQHVIGQSRLLWPLDEAVLSRLRAIVNQAACAGLGARLVMTRVDSSLRVLMSAGSPCYPWRALSLSVLERRDVLADDQAVAAPVQGPYPLQGVLLLYTHEPCPAPASPLRQLVRAHAAHLEEVLVGASESLKATHDAVEALYQALAAHDPQTARHTAMVRRLAGLLAEIIGLDEVELRTLDWGAALHDIGKLTISSDLLQKVEPLTAAEWALLRQHPVAGERIVAGIAGLKHVIPIVRHHHERWDGTGYPDRLCGPSIPFPARLIALVDAYDTMRYGRPYRPALEHHEVIQELQRCTATHFDPALNFALAVLSTRELTLF